MTTPAHVHRLRVRWSEVDAQGVVFNPNYFVYADVAATEFLRANGILAHLNEELQQIFAVDARAAFRGSARFDDELDIHVRTARIGRSSFALDIGIHRQERPLTEVVLTYARAIDGVAVPLSEDFRTRLGQPA
ncbi:MAG: acyl-CoA thioesterase [Alphaproteobacteria bacterium]|nr:acyl-CoA thioesterase [Alphaproteobacteria bacterium]MBU2377677.1 acyl-CoA thioesterase [Alphaproteobacteria bacterium]